MTMDIYRICMQLFQENYRRGTIRHVSVSITNLEPENMQLSFFEDLNRKRDLGYVMDEIRRKYGSTALLRASSYTSDGVMLDRASKIGGHRA